MRRIDQWVEDPASALLCSMDPLTMAATALGGLAGAAFGGGGKASAPTPTPPPAPPPPAATPAPKKQSGQTSSFIGGIPTPPPSTGQKTLLGT